ncbi:MAG: HEAT repeat domain-containing protein [Fimbriimonadaceae bacterium]|nr:HEAT repeat domain-containing protein [Fimbriimonadaceae bacterium]
MGTAATATACFFLALSQTQFNAEVDNLCKAYPNDKTVAKYGAKAIEPLEAVLRGTRPGKKIGCARALAMIGPPEAPKLFASLLSSSDKEDQLAGMCGLGVLKDPRAVQIAILELEAGRNELLAMDVLANCKAEEGIPLLIERLARDPAFDTYDSLHAVSISHSTGLVAAIALGRYGKIAVPELRLALESRNKTIRYRAAQALQHIPDSGLASKLIALYEQDPDIQVSSAAILAAAATGDKRVISAVLRRVDKRNVGADLLALGMAGGDEQIPILEEYLWKAELGAAEGLAAMGSDKAHKTLEKALLNSPEESAIGSHVSDALALYPNFKLAPAMVQALRLGRGDPWSLQRILANFGVKVIPLLQPMIDSSDEQIQLFACNIVCMIDDVRAFSAVWKLARDSKRIYSTDARWRLGQLIFGNKPFPEDWFSRKL